MNKNNISNNNKNIKNQLSNGVKKTNFKKGFTRTPTLASHLSFLVKLNTYIKK